MRGRDNGYGTRGGEGAGVPVKPEGDNEDDDSDGSTSSSSSDDDDDDEDESAPETNNVHTRVPALPTSLAPTHPTPSDVHQSDDTPPSGAKEQCRAFIRTGRCKFGSRCRYDHPVGGFGFFLVCCYPARDERGLIRNAGVGCRTRLGGRRTRPGVRRVMGMPSQAKLGLDRQRRIRSLIHSHDRVYLML